MNKSIKDITKWQKFYLIVIFIVSLSTVISLVIDELFFSESDDNYRKIVLILPNDDSLSNIKQSADVFVSIFNKENTVNSQKLRVETVSSRESLSNIEKIVLAKNTLGVISFNNDVSLNPIYDVTKTRGIPVVTNNTLHAGVVNIGYDSDDALKFMMNYAKGIIAQQDIYVFSNDTEEASRKVDIIRDVYQKDNVNKVNVIHVPSDIDEKYINYVVEYFNNVDYGSVYLAVNEEQSLKLLPIIKNTSSVLDVFGDSYFALSSIKNKLGDDRENILNGIYTSTPILYDTANTKAQKFANNYFIETNNSADWLSAKVYSACEMITQTGKDYTRYDTILGNYDKKTSEINLPMKIARYTADTLISTPIQLTPIQSTNLDNYVLAIKENRAVFINDKFMYKTNVVYTGLKLENISELKFDDETAKIKFSIWFRYRGEFNPKDIVFTNSVAPIVLSEPNSEIKKDDLVYKEYLVSGVFRMNFNQLRTRYDRNNIEVVFQHKKYNVNNLIFVTDFLGMPKVDELRKNLSATTILSDDHWRVQDATLSQEVILAATKGAPNYVEFQGEKPLFSQVSFVASIGSTYLNIRQYFDKKYFVYMLILGGIGFFFAVMMDLNRWGKYWSLQAWILRFIGLPLMLLAIGNMIIDYVFIYTDLGTTNLFIQLYDSLWYLLPAYLLISAIRRFLWLPLERKTGKKIPEIAQVFVASVIYLSAVFFIVSLVFNESVTNFLAASGIFATVIGLAIHEKISDIFSGIILNIERPFYVGDFVRFSKNDCDIAIHADFLTQGTIVDIGWRGTVIRRIDGIKIVIKNSEMLNMVTENITRTSRFNHINTVTVSQKANAQEVISLISKSLNDCYLVIKHEEQIDNLPSVRFSLDERSSTQDGLSSKNSSSHNFYRVLCSKIEHADDGWLCEYTLYFSTKQYEDNEKVMESIWHDLLNASPKLNVFGNS